MTLEEAKAIVFEKKPVFAQLYKDYDTRTWLDYAKNEFPKTSFLGDNTRELIGAFEKLLTPLIGKEKTGRAAKTLAATGFVSTADHHGVLGRHFIVGIGGRINLCKSSCCSKEKHCENAPDRFECFHGSRIQIF